VFSIPWLVYSATQINFIKITAHVHSPSGTLYIVYYC
jgi:hypothetical protein